MSGKQNEEAEQQRKRKEYVAKQEMEDKGEEEDAFVSDEEDDENVSWDRLDIWILAYLLSQPQTRLIEPGATFFL